MKMVVPTMSDTLREHVLKLMSEKDKIEQKINDLTAVLTANNVGINEPLVDNEGFPINTIDIYQVRHARHQIICLQNDHKALMKQIEKGLHEIHSQKQTENIKYSQATGTASTSTVMEVDSENSSSLTPIARVNFVNQGSPADIDGIHLNDLILEFGTVNPSNFKRIEDIGTVVKHSNGFPIAVKIQRGTRIFNITLTPRAWPGRGLLGCNIILLENIER